MLANYLNPMRVGGSVLFILVAGFVVARRWATMLTIVFTSGRRIVSR